MLSDFWPHGEVAKAYGVFDDTRGCAIRATFVIDKSGDVVDTFQTTDLGTAREQSALRSGPGQAVSRSGAAAAAAGTGLRAGAAP